MEGGSRQLRAHRSDGLRPRSRGVLHTQGSEVDLVVLERFERPSLKPLPEPIVLQNHRPWRKQLEPIRVVSVNEDLGQAAAGERPEEAASWNNTRRVRAREAEAEHVRRRVFSNSKSATAKRTTSDLSDSVRDTSQPPRRFSTPDKPRLTYTDSKRKLWESWQATLAAEKASFQSFGIEAELHLQRAQKVALNGEQPNELVTAAAFETLYKISCGVGRYGPLMHRVLRILRQAVYEEAIDDDIQPLQSMEEAAALASCYSLTPYFISRRKQVMSFIRELYGELRYATLREVQSMRDTQRRVLRAWKQVVLESRQARIMERLSKKIDNMRDESAEMHHQHQILLTAEGTSFVFRQLSEEVQLDCLKRMITPTTTSKVVATAAAELGLQALSKEELLGVMAAALRSRTDISAQDRSELLLNFSKAETVTPVRVRPEAIVEYPVPSQVASESEAED